MSSAKPPTKSARSIIAISLVILAVCGFFLWQRSQGPRYKGKTVEQWLATVGRSETLHTNEVVRAMLATLGTNAIPPLLEILEPKDSMLLGACRQFTRNNGLPKSLRAIAAARIERERQQAVAAAGAIRLLGTNAEMAILDLEKLARDTNSPLGGTAALFALTGLGKPAGASITRLRTNAPPAVRSIISIYVESYWAELLHHGNQSQREEAALELSWSNSKAVEAIPVLESISESRDREKREAAMRALSRLKRGFPEARDAIRKATNSTYPDVREMAQDDLRQLDGIRKLKTFD